MRESIKEFVKIIADTLPIVEPIYEFGLLQVPGQESFAYLRPIFGLSSAVRNMSAVTCKKVLGSIEY